MRLPSLRSRWSVRAASAIVVTLLVVAAPIVGPLAFLDGPVGTVSAAETSNKTSDFEDQTVGNAPNEWDGGTITDSGYGDQSKSLDTTGLSFVESTAYTINTSDAVLDTRVNLQTSTEEVGFRVSDSSSSDIVDVYYNNEFDELAILDKDGAREVATVSIDATNTWINIKVKIDSDTDTVKAKVWKSSNSEPGWQATTNSLSMAADSYESSLEIYGDGYYDNVKANANAPKKVSGRVTDTGGTPIEGATVVGYAATTPTVSDSQNLLSDISNPRPPKWTEQGGKSVDLLSEFESADSYVATHTQDALPRTAPWVDSADLRTPKVALPANEPIVLSAWDGTASGFGVNRCIPGVGNEYDCQLPGESKDSASIVVERLDGAGATTSKDVVNLNEVSGGGLGDPDSFHYTTLELEPGYYLMYEEGSANKGVVRQVGTPTAILDRYQQNAEGQLSEQASNIKSEIDANNLQRVTTSTDSNGRYSFEVSPSAKVVTVQAYKAPALLDQGYSASSITQQDIRTEYNDALSKNYTDLTSAERDLLNSSVYFPSLPQTAEPPATGVDITMVELSAPPGANVSGLQDRLSRLEKLLQNGTFSDLPPALQQRLEDLNREELENLYSDLDRLRERNDELSERVNELLGEDQKLNVNPEEATDSELKTRIEALQQAMTELRSSIESGDGVVEKSSDAVSYSKEFDADLTKDDVVVIADFTNGTSLVVPDEYVTVDNSLAGGSTVSINEYPIPADVGGVVFDIKASTDEGFGKSTSQPIQNPLFEGTLPTLESVAFSSLQPATGNPVSVGFEGTEDSSFKSVTNVTIYGPDGSQVSAGNITDGKRFNFTPSSPGIYHVRTTIEDTDGNSYVNTNRIKATGQDVNRPPSLRAKESPLGTYAVVGDGLEAGGVETSTDGVNIFAQIGQSADVPSKIHVYTESLSTARDGVTDISVVRGETRQSVNRHVRLIVHGKSLSQDALVYRSADTDAPITTDADTRYGKVTKRVNGSTIETYTRGDGSVSIRTVNSPTILERVLFNLRVRTSSIDLPVVGTLAMEIAASTSRLSPTATRSNGGVAA